MFITNNLIPALYNTKTWPWIVGNKEFWQYMRILTSFIILWQFLGVLYLAIAYMYKVTFKISTCIYITVFFVFMTFLISDYTSIKYSKVRSLIALYCFFPTGILIYFGRKKSYIPSVKYKLLLLVLMMISSSLLVINILNYNEIKAVGIKFYIPLTGAFALSIVALKEETLYKLYFTAKNYLLIMLLMVVFLFYESGGDIKRIILHIVYLAVFGVIGKSIYREHKAKFKSLE